VDFKTHEAPICHWLNIFFLETMIEKSPLGSQTLWQYAHEKCKSIAKYNCSRGQSASYFLANPDDEGSWTSGSDVIIFHMQFNIRDLSSILNARVKK